MYQYVHVLDMYVCVHVHVHVHVRVHTYVYVYIYMYMYMYMYVRLACKLAHSKAHAGQSGRHRTRIMCIGTVTYRVPLYFVSTNSGRNSRMDPCSLAVFRYLQN